MNEPRLPARFIVPETVPAFTVNQACGSGLRALILAAERYNKPEPVNIGSGAEISISALVELIAKATGFSGVVRWQQDKPNGQMRRFLDTSRARDEFGFEAETSLAEGLARTIQWYLKHNANSN